MSEVLIKNLRVQARVGVPDQERRTAQELTISVRCETLEIFAALEDDIARTIDYDLACQRIAALCADRPRKLIETLANDIAEMLVADFPVCRADVEVRKFILPQTDHVAVRCTKHR